jgi:competence protein CoiA
MSTFAKDGKKTLVKASLATRSIDYFCLECGHAVRLKMGEERRAHFYHLEPTDHCREAGKSLEHLMTQFAVQNAFKKKNQEIVLEKQFHHIQRIADAVDLTNKIVFEIQCSPMSALEAKGRMLDYQSIGYCVVWIIHLKTFLKNKATAFEQTLMDVPHYFTDIDENGEGEIFDLFSPIHKGYRLNQLDRRFPVDVGSFSKNILKYPFRKKWPLSFDGDILFHLRQNSLDMTTRNTLFHYLYADKEPFEEKTSSCLTLFQKGLFHLKLFFEEKLRAVSKSSETNYTHSTSKASIWADSKPRG